MSAGLVPEGPTPMATRSYHGFVAAVLAAATSSVGMSTAWAQNRPAARPAAKQPAGARPSQGKAPVVQNLAPAAPFTLTETQQRLLDQTLLRWEKQSEKVSTYLCDFHRWEIDPAWGPKPHGYTLTQAEGTIRYKAPDRGEYEVDKVTRWDKTKATYVADDTAAERWMCDGQDIYEWNRKQRQLKVRPLPDELRGKAIADGPLPFVFGAKADQLKRRYWMRDVTPTEHAGKQIWLEARPKFQQDAANFQRATVVLDEKSFMPVALQLFPPGIAPVAGKPEAYTAFQFMRASVNNPLDKLVFLPPITPPFWTKVVVKPPTAPGAGGTGGAVETRPATSRAPAAPRK